jgi:Flp pilus assembly protein CpaB
MHRLAGRASVRSAPAERITQVLEAMRRRAIRHRRLIAALCAGLSVIVMAATTNARHGSGVAVVAAARDLPSGATLTTADLTTVILPTTAIPAGAITSAAVAIGRPIAGALRRGEPLTDARIDHGALSAPRAGFVAAPVRLADAEAAALLQPGERIDVLAASTAPAGETASAAAGEAAVVAAGVRVVAIPTPTGGPSNVSGADFSGALVILATTPEQARALAQAEVSARLSAVVVG